MGLIAAPSALRRVPAGGAALVASDPFFFPPSLIRDEWLSFGPSDASVPLDARSGRLYVGLSATLSPGSPDSFAVSWDEVRIVPEPGAALSAWLRRRRA